MTALATERDYETTILDAAAYGGWLAHAERPARSAKGWRTPIRGTAGWPDLVLCGHGRLIVCELKIGRNKPTAEQQRWLEELAHAGLDARCVRADTPELDDLVAELIRPVPNQGD